MTSDNILQNVMIDAAKLQALSTLVSRMSVKMVMMRVGKLPRSADFTPPLSAHTC